jgi:predicted LPLAT superfamily acyltransferase
MHSSWPLPQLARQGEPRGARFRIYLSFAIGVVRQLCQLARNKCTHMVSHTLLTRTFLRQNALFFEGPKIIATCLRRVLFMVHNYTATQLHSYTATQLNSYIAKQLHSHTSTQLHSYTATQLHSYAATQQLTAVGTCRGG